MLNRQNLRQPPSGGCVLKPRNARGYCKAGEQPPSGGCVLKQPGEILRQQRPEAAAFGRLCVETQNPNLPTVVQNQQPPSGGCVLKLLMLQVSFSFLPAAAFGRLCVEPNSDLIFIKFLNAAAFGRLCVETKRIALSVSSA